jgi:hypothetical protein
LRAKKTSLTPNTVRQIPSPPPVQIRPNST